MALIPPFLTLPAALAIVAGLFLPAAEAAPVKVEGLIFSDELGGFRILSVTGTGTPSDPFVVIEEITGEQEAILVVHGLVESFGNRIGSQHLIGFALRKVVINRTVHEWNLYELELRETLDSPSPYGDGLSFGQASGVGRPFQSSGFPINDEKDEPHDAVSFTGGSVRPGDTVSFELIVTDASPVSPIMLLQQPTKVLAHDDRMRPAVRLAAAPADPQNHRTPQAR